MSLSSITPVVLTFNEEANIGRALDSLRDFPRVVVVDSGSTDGTERIARSFPGLSWFTRPWTGFADQWAFGLGETGIRTPFVLALDADMSPTAELKRELAEVATRDDVDGGVIPFEYRIRGVPLFGSLYPPQLRLLRREKARSGQHGHAHSLQIETGGTIVRLKARLIHDDRKPLEAFAHAQIGYSAVEVQRFADATGASGMSAWVRRAFPFAPHAVWLLAWLRAGGPFRGPAARRYALERLIYESMLRWRIEDSLLGKKPAGKGDEV